MQKDITHFVLIIAFLSITTGVICVIVWAAWLEKDYPNFMNIAMIIATAVSTFPFLLPLLICHFVAFVDNCIPKLEIDITKVICHCCLRARRSARLRYPHSYYCCQTHVQKQCTRSSLPLCFVLFDFSPPLFFCG